ncbi:MAG: PD40 domain-containing protein [Bacteroidales bacterium]|nr:PD40 domain-containing protein [Bacteroidales bacterium]
MKNAAAILILELSLVALLYGQEPASMSKKAIDYYNRGLHHYTLNDYARAADYLNKAVSEDSAFVKAWLILAQVYEDWKQSAIAIAIYRKVVSIKPDYYPYALVHLARLEYKMAQYKEARNHYKQFLELPGSKNEKHIEKAKDGIARCDFSIHAVDNPVNFKPVTLGTAINTGEDEYWPSISADEQILVITRLTEGKFIHGNKQEDFYISNWTEEGWGPLREAGYPLNSPDNEGAQTISANGRRMVFTGCNRPDGLGRCDLYLSEKMGENWSIPVNIGTPVNSNFTETQPSLSADGKTMFFASDRPGGCGAVDIWVCREGDDGKWTKPVNLGDTVNSSGNEMSPFIHPDGKTLYLASDGHIGLGGYDLFICRQDSAGRWTKPENMGYPINTNKDEFGLIVNPSGNRAYFASDIDEQNGRDIYYFDLPESVKPNYVSYMKGIVYDKETRRRLKASFELVDLKTRDLINKSQSDSITGEFLVCIPVGRNFLLNVSKNGYLFFSENFSVKGIHLFDKPFLKDIPLSPVKVGEVIILKNIFYETDSYTLKEESIVELNKLVKFLRDNPHIKIEISGHTDNVGTADYNIKLSDSRSKSVADYLTKADIAQERLVCRGYGLSLPIASNETEEGRAQNRRTEVKIIE